MVSELGRGGGQFLHVRCAEGEDLDPGPVASPSVAIRYKKNMRILVLDDSLARQEIFKKRLAGHELTHVTTRDEAIKALNEQPRFDLAYLDHSLGETEGPLNPGLLPHELPTGMHVVDHITKTLPAEKRPKTCIVHSMDYDPSKEMVARLRDVGIEADRQPFAA